MTAETNEKNILKKNFIDLEIDWMLAVLDWRIKVDLQLRDDTSLADSWQELQEPALEGNDPYVQLIKELSLSKEQRLVVALSLMPQLLPGTFARYLAVLEEKFHGDVGYIEANNGTSLPTILTAVFLLAGIQDLKVRTDTFVLVLNHPLLKNGLIQASLDRENELFLKPIQASSSLFFLLSGKINYEEFTSQKEPVEPTNH